MRNVCFARPIETVHSLLALKGEMSEHTDKKVEWVHCNQCLGQTRHEVIASRTITQNEGNHEYSWVTWTTTSTMLECRGCGSIILRRRVISHDVDWDETSFYPPPVSRQMPSWVHGLPEDLKSLVKEIYVALHANSRRLAVMGSRALVDLFLNRTLGDIGGFEVKLNKLVEDGYLSQKNRDVLDAALDAGHAVIHRGHDPKVEDVNIVFDIVENLLQTIVLKKMTAGLREHTPQRKKPPTRST